MKKEPKKKITIEDLAVMVGNGFNEVHGKFNEVNGKFNEVHEKFDEVHDKIDKGFADVNSSLGQIKSRLTSVEENQLDLKLRMDVLSQNNRGIDDLRGRVGVLEKKVGAK